MNADAMKAKGVDTIAVTAVNDAWVMAAWKRDTDPKNQVEFLGRRQRANSPRRSASTSISPGGGMGIRSKRYSMLVEDGVVKKLNIEEKPGVVEMSGGDTLLKQL